MRCFFTDGILSDFILYAVFCLYLGGLLPGCLKSLQGLSWILGVVAFALVGGCTTRPPGGSGGIWLRWWEGARRCLCLSSSPAAPLPPICPPPLPPTSHLPPLMLPAAPSTSGTHTQPLIHQVFALFSTQKKQPHLFCLSQGVLRLSACDNECVIVH